MPRIAFIIATLFALLTVSPSLAADPRPWPSELTIRQFKIHSDFALPAPSELTAELDALSRDLEQMLQLTSERKTVHIVLFETPTEYARYMRTYFPKLPERRALFIQDRGPGMLFTHWHADVRTDIRHEVTHALLNEQAAALPLWLDEGLAEYFEVEASLRFDANPYAAEVAQRASEGIVPSLLELERVSLLENFGHSLYRDSWSWIHFLLHRSSKTRGLLVQYLKHCRGGERQLPLSRQLVSLLPDLNAEYQQHYALLPLREQATRVTQDTTGRNALSTDCNALSNR